MKQSPWLSFLLAVGKSISSANRRIRLGQFPNGKMRLFELGLGQLAQKIALVFVGVNARQQPVGHLSIHLERFLAAVMAGRYAFCPNSREDSRNKSNLTSRLHSTSGLGVRPAAYSSNM